MSAIPPIISVPPPLPGETPPPPRKKNVWWKVVIGLAVAFAGFLLLPIILSLILSVVHPPEKRPGEKAFDEANRQIMVNHGTVAFGNSSEAVALAQDFGKALKILREGFFTEGKDDAFSISKGEFLTYCQLNEDSCVFLVHVPELRHFTSEAQDSLSELAWVNAQSVLKTKLPDPPATVVVGMKGAVLYDSILIGDFLGEPQEKGDGIKTRGSGLKDIKLLFPFFQ